ncbi:MAG: fumarate hydratase, partial [Alphaproteobacteria bacterium]|nr:fumarate hydratase [Alphaproteobacteria bacterium]
MTITRAKVEEAAFTIMQKAAIDIPDDYLGGIKRMSEREDGDLSAFVLKAMLDNYEAAKEDRRPMCADTGLPRYYVKMGDKAQLDCFVGLDQGLRAATARATTEV